MDGTINSTMPNVNKKGKSSKAEVAKSRLSSDFFKKGITLGLFSGMMYGLYSAFMTLAMTKGVWADWYGPNTALLSAFTITYLLGSLGGAVNDICSAIWAIVFAMKNGKFGDFLRTINTAPGRLMILAALAGGPIATTAYVIGLQMAGSIVIPITALCPATGAILGRIIFKEKIEKRTAIGIAICVVASFLIGSVGISADAPDGMLLGMLIAFLAALGWGFEGCVAGYGTSMIDSEIGIAIRQTTAGLSNLLILVPIIGAIGGNISLSKDLAVQAFTSGPAMIWFAVSGLCAFLSYMTWYKGNSMSGTALGMACNATYSFWGPFFCWILLGVINGIDGWALSTIQWVAAILMIFGILVIAVNPLDLFKKDKNKVKTKSKPLNYAILNYFTKVEEASAEDVIFALKAEYGGFSALNREDVLSALMTAEANGILEEARFEMDDKNNLRIYYRANSDGRATINKYIK